MYQNTIEYLNEKPKKRYKSILYLGLRQFRPFDLTEKLYFDHEDSILDRIESEYVNGGYLKIRNKKNLLGYYPVLLMWDNKKGEKKFAEINIIKHT